MFERKGQVNLQYVTIVLVIVALVGSWMAYMSASGGLTTDDLKETEQNLEDTITSATQKETTETDVINFLDGKSWDDAKSILDSAGIKVPEQEGGTQGTFSGIDIHYFAGGPAGGSFASKLVMGAKDARNDTGADVKIKFSGWKMDRMVSQFKESVAAEPDAICMMGHPGIGSLETPIKEAHEKGINLNFQNVWIPEIYSELGYKDVGYVGVPDLFDQGYDLGEKTINEYGLTEDDTALVLGAWNQPARADRENGTAVAFEDIGMKVHRMLAPPEWAGNPQQMVTPVSTFLQKHPEVNVLCTTGGQQLQVADDFLKAADDKSGPEGIIHIGYDMNPKALQNMKDGWIQLSSNQLAYEQGYLPVVSACLQERFKFPGLFVNTIGAYYTPQNVEDMYAY